MRVLTKTVLLVLRLFWLMLLITFYLMRIALVVALLPLLWIGAALAGASLGGAFVWLLGGARR